VATTRRVPGPATPARRSDGPTPAALKSRALRWLAQRDHSRAELERKLITHARALARLAEAAAAEGAASADSLAADPAADRREIASLADSIDPADPVSWPEPVLRERVAAVLARLDEAGLLNEPRMAEALLAAKAPRLGERRLRQALQQRGLPPALVDDAVEQTRGSELERARALWQRRFGEPAPDAAGRLRQMRFLAGRGFGSDVIRRVVRGAGLPDDDDAFGADEAG
jgi:regulatory protein